MVVLDDDDEFPHTLAHEVERADKNDKDDVAIVFKKHNLLSSSSSLSVFPCRASGKNKSLSLSFLANAQSSLSAVCDE